MRLPLLLSGILFFSAASAQQITNVTTTPSPLRACQPVTFNIHGTSAGGLNVSFVQTNIGESSITLILSVSTGPGSASFTHSIGPMSALAEGVYDMTFKLERNGNITSTWTGTLNVLPPQLPNVGLPSTALVCPNDEPFHLLSRIDGNPDAGGTWQDPLLNILTGDMFIPGTSPAGDYLYYFDMQAPCDMQYQILTITYLPNTTAGKDTSISVCTLPGSPVVDLFPLLGSTAPAGGTWTGPSNTGTFIPGTTPPGQYVYHVTGIAPCPDPTATVTVAAGTPPNAGTGGSGLYCFDEDAANLSAHISGGDATGIWYSPTGIGVAYFNNPVDVATYGAGTYLYVVETGPCPADTAYVVVTLDGPPCTIGIDERLAPAGNVQVVPNPAKDRISVEVELLQAVKGLELVICDVGGRVVLRQALPGGTSIRGTVDISSLAPGSYTVQFLGDLRLPARRLVVR